MLRILRTLAVGTLAAIALSATAADPWPSKPIKLIVPFGAGGTSDIAARVMGERLSQRLGQPLIVENKPGVSGLLGTEFASKAPADGYTMLLTSIGPMAFAPSTPKQLGYDVNKDFTHVGMIGTIPLVLIVNNDFPAKSLEDVVSQAKRKPNTLNFGSSGPASPSHLMLERFKARFALDIAHIPFKSGSAASLTEIIGGRVDGTWDALPALLTMIKAGKVRPLAITGAQRHPLLPEVPTVGELGYSDLTATSWFAFAVPAGTPKDVVQKLNATLNAELQTPAVKTKLGELAFATSTISPDEMQKFVATEVEKWKPVVVNSKISFQ